MRVGRGRAVLVGMALVVSLIGVGPGVGTAEASPSTPIMAPPQLTGAELAAWFASTGRRPHPGVSVSIRTLADLFVEEGRAEGVRGDIAFAQSVLETGYFSYPDSGCVRAGYNNFGGIGATDGCRSRPEPQAHVFPSARIGVRAQIQHLRGYADPAVCGGPNNPSGCTSTNLARPRTSPAEWPCCSESPRFHLVVGAGRGRAPTWAGLTGTWATDPQYTNKIMGIWGQILDHARPTAPTGGVPLVGDWNGNGRQTPGVFKDGVFYLRNANSGGRSDIVVRFGRTGDMPVVGDWNGNGRDGIGVFRSGTWYLRNALSTGGAQVTTTFGRNGDIPVVGDWNGNGRDALGVFRDGRWFFRCGVTGGGSNWFDFGRRGDQPIVGDYNGDGRDSPGVFRNGRWFLRRSVTDSRWGSFSAGSEGDVAFLGNWNGRGGATPMVYRRSVRFWYGRDTLTSGPTTIRFRFG